MKLGFLDGIGRSKIKYKGKYYVVENCKREQKVRPIGKWDDPNEKEITVKDWNVGFWNVTVNVNGEKIVVGWGFGKHFTVWGSVFFIIMFLFFAIRRHCLKRKRDPLSPYY